MGADMRSGQFELHGRRACGLVSAWCSEYEPEVTVEDWKDNFGLFEYSDSSVVQANAAVPMCYKEAREKNFPVVDRNTFSYARLFLQDAATTGEGISGSY